MDEAVAQCHEFVRTGLPSRHMAVNAAKVVAMKKDERLRRIVEESDLVTADGQSLVWASRLLGAPLPGRVAGIDLMCELLALADRRGYRVYLLGARQSALDAAVAHVSARYPGLTLAGARNGYFTEAEAGMVAEDIARARPDMLFVGMSSPFKEYFLDRFGDTMQIPVMMGVGGAIDVLAGVTARAPRPVQRLGLEWLFRLLQEPRRLGRRYLVTNSLFLALLARAMVHDRVRGQG
jgi:N-acetylglucosaminyldiphosphoundecaprenol N-acetyl-beta-D-mannosaminyltransferase